MSRAAVVAEALTWLGTPYHPHARIKGAGVDCAMLLGEVYHACGLLPDNWAPGYYAPDWHLHRSEELYLQGIERYARKIHGDPLPGDVALFKFGMTTSHGAIVIQWPRVIHAYRGRGVVFNDATDGELVRRYQGAWTLFDEEAD